MLQLKPKEKFYISRHLADPTDTDTYYVRGFVRDKNTDALLDTVDLIETGAGSAGDLRFSGEWEVSADPSGNGRYIVVITKVYTDSGYTTLSPNYAVEEREYLIQERWNWRFGGGGGSGIDYKKLRKILRDEIEKIPPAERPEEVDLIPILDAIESIGKISDIKIPPQKEVNLSPVLDGLRNLKSQISNLPAPERFNYERIERNINRLMKAIKIIDTRGRIKTMFEHFQREINNLKEAMKKPIKLTLHREEKSIKQKEVKQTKKEPPKKEGPDFLKLFETKLK